METKIFNVATSVSMVITSTVAVLSFIGVVVTGLYPGIIVLCLIALIPISSKFYAKKMTIQSKSPQRNYFTLLTIINLLSILIVLWMTFVILVDRVFSEV